MVAMTWRARTIAALQSAMIERMMLTMMLFAALPTMAMAPPYCDTVRACETWLAAACGWQLWRVGARFALAPRRGERSTLPSDSAGATCQPLHMHMQDTMACVPPHKHTQRT